MATLEQIAWAAGLFDGEGSITHNDRELQAHLKTASLASPSGSGLPGATPRTT